MVAIVAGAARYTADLGPTHVGRLKSQQELRIEQTARDIAQLEREAYVANDREHAAMCRDALAALFGRNTSPTALAALATCIAELDRRRVPS